MKGSSSRTVFLREIGTLTADASLSKAVLYPLLIGWSTLKG